MKQKLIILFSLVLLAVVVYLISRDLFTGSGKTEKNPCEYNLDKLKAINPELIKYKVIRHFKPSMEKITGIAIDDNAYAYISGTKGIQVFDKDGKKISGFSVDSTANCIAIGLQHEVYLGVGDHVERYNKDGSLQQKWDTYANRGYITSIAVRGDDVFVADAGNRLVLHYNTSGKLLNTIGKKDKDFIGLIISSMYLDVAIGSFDDLWVVNPGKHELENFSDKGELRSSWGVPSMQLEGFAGCCNPIHFSMLPNGYFVTYEKGMDRIKLYNQAGKFDCVVASPASFTGKSEYHCSFATIVNDLAVDQSGNIYALDATSNEVKVFGKNN